MTGSRPGRTARFLGLLARAAARDVTVFVVPDIEVARNAELAPDAIDGLHVVATPRHATVMLIASPLPPTLARAAAVAYAQMPRPRWILATETAQVAELPAPDVVIPADQAGLRAAVAELRHLVGTAAFEPKIVEFAPRGVQTRTVYVCPMHPQIVEPMPGTCPICGMDLVQHEVPDDELGAAAGHDSHRGTDQTSAATSTVAEHMPADEMGNAATAHAASGDAGHPEAMHAEPERHGEQADEHGRSDELELPSHGRHAPDAGGGSAAMDEHGQHSVAGSGAGHAGHGDGFMSMIDVTKDLPRSPDGLPMDWLVVPFGPLFPGLPGGLALVLTLDGDTVASAEVRPSAVSGSDDRRWPGPLETLPARVAHLDRLAPNSYAVLAWTALANAGGQVPGERAQRARVGLLERARIISHLGWLSALGRLLGYRWLAEAAGTLQRAAVHAAAITELASLRDEAERLAERLDRTPMLRRRLRGVGLIPEGYGDWVSGPVARAAGRASDARTGDPAYEAFGFTPVTRHESDALARLEVRSDELLQSFELLRAAGEWELPTPTLDAEITESTATLELPRGQATVTLGFNRQLVKTAGVTVPSAMHVDMLPVVAEGIELADALVAVASLDLSPWELGQ